MVSINAFITGQGAAAGWFSELLKNIANFFGELNDSMVQLFQVSLSHAALTKRQMGPMLNPLQTYAYESNFQRQVSTLNWPFELNQRFVVNHVYRKSNSASTVHHTIVLLKPRDFILLHYRKACKKAKIDERTGKATGPSIQK